MNDISAMHENVKNGEEASKRSSQVFREMAIASQKTSEPDLDYSNSYKSDETASEAHDPIFQQTLSSFI